MILLDEQRALWYKSNSQKARVLTEFWTWENIFCPACGENISQYENNRPVADFYCKKCSEDFELKSGMNLWKKITDGAYGTMIERLKSDNNPNFFFLNYSKDFQIKNFVVIPKHYFTQEIIEKRKPLPITAKRAGWIGCNILLEPIPESGKIFYIKNGDERKKQDVLSDWSRTLFLRQKTQQEAKWWMLDVMRCIEILHKKEFELKELYDFELALAQKYPNNNFIKDKIRQQLQNLRDVWYLEFLERGKYRIL